MIIGIQIIAILFSLCMVYFALLAYKRKELSGVEILSWLVLWILAIVVVVFPELLQTFAKTFFVTRVFDLMVIGGFILVITLVSLTYIRTKRNERKLEELVRRGALRDVKVKK